MRRQKVIEHLLTKYPHPNIEWDMRVFSEFASIQFIKDNGSIEWDFNCIAQNKELTIDFVLENLSQFKKVNSMDDVAANSSISLNDIKQNMDIFKNYFYGLSKNENVDISFVNEHPLFPWRMCHLSHHISLEDILNNQQHEWDTNGYEYIHPMAASVNKDLIINNLHRVSSFFHNTFVEEFIISSKLPYDDIIEILKLTVVPMDKILKIFSKIDKWALFPLGKYGDENFSEQYYNIIKTMPLNEILTNNELLKYYTDSKYFECLSINPTLTLSHILNNIKESWDFRRIASNEAILFDEILENQIMLLKCRLSDMLENPNITLSFVEKNIHSFNKAEIKALSKNTFTFNKRIYERPLLLLYLKKSIPLEIINEIYKYC